MRIETKPIKELVQDPENSREHGERNLQAIEQSLAAFGQQKPIVINKEGKVIAGNGTLKAAQAIGWETIQVVETELPDLQQKAFAVADNRTAEIATWNDEALARTIKELAKMDHFLPLQIGFDEEEINKILSSSDDNTTAELENQDSQVDGESHTVVLTFTTAEYVAFGKCVTMLKESHGIQDMTQAVIAAVEQVTGLQIA